jgi:hypothetical protein
MARRRSSNLGRPDAVSLRALPAMVDEGNRLKKEDQSRCELACKRRVCKRT